MSTNRTSNRQQHDEGISDAAGGRSTVRETHEEASFRHGLLLAMNPSSLSSEIPGLTLTRGPQGNFSKVEEEATSAAPSTVCPPGTEYIRNSRATPTYHSYYPQNQSSSGHRLLPQLALRDSTSTQQDDFISATLHEMQESQARLMIHINRASELVQKSPPTNKTSAEESKRKLPVAEKKIVIPCRARGMPADHSTKTAYLVINEGTQHGDSLLCSHVVCRKRGVRFLYCAYCDEPVAKGNFSTRHSHPGQVRKNPTRANDSSSASKKPHDQSETRSTSQSSASSSREPGQNESKSTTPAAIAAPTPTSYELTAYDAEGRARRKDGETKTGRHQQVIRAPSSLSSVAPGEHANQLQRTTTMGDEDGEDDDDDDDVETYSTKSSHNIDQDQDSEDEYYDDSSTSTLSQGPRRKAARNVQSEGHSPSKWASLLEERPTTDKGDELKTWLARVIAYSEPTSSHGFGSDNSEARAANLLERPRTTDPAEEELARNRDKKRKN